MTIIICQHCQYDDNDVRSINVVAIVHSNITWLYGGHNVSYVVIDNRRRLLVTRPVAFK